MICYEMIGYFSDEPGSQKFPSEEVARMYPDTGNYIVVVGIEKCREFNTPVSWLNERIVEKSPCNELIFPMRTNLLPDRTREITGPLATMP